MIFGCEPFLQFLLLAYCLDQCQHEIPGWLYMFHLHSTCEVSSWSYVLKQLRNERVASNFTQRYGWLDLMEYKVIRGAILPFICFYKLKLKVSEVWLITFHFGELIQCITLHLDGVAASNWAGSMNLCRMSLNNSSSLDSSLNVPYGT